MQNPLGTSLQLSQFVQASNFPHLSEYIKKINVITQQTLIMIKNAAEKD